MWCRSKWSCLQAHNPACKMIPMFHPTGVKGTSVLSNMVVGSTHVSSNRGGKECPYFVQQGDEGTLYHLTGGKRIGAPLFHLMRVWIPMFCLTGLGNPVSSNMWEVGASLSQQRRVWGTLFFEQR